jgi:Dockerin type I domain/Beta-propeller repeat
MKTTLIIIILAILSVFVSVQANQVALDVQQMKLRPLAFTENQGQWDERVKFRADAGGAIMWFSEEGVCYQFVKRISMGETDPDDPFQLLHERLEQEPDSFEQLVLKTSFVGANPNPEIMGEDEMEYKCNYFIGNDPNEWHTDVPNYQSVYIKEIYSGIDLKYYGNGKQMEYDFIVSPGTDYSQIQIQYVGAKSLSVNLSGELVVETDWGSVTEQKPIVYQMDGNKRQEIEGKYNITDNNRFSFKLDDNYNRNLPVVIDPVLIYSTYLGGSGVEAGWGIAVDTSGCAYVTGRTSSTDFPTEGPYQATHQGANYDVFITKLSSVGNSLIYSTYLGGSSSDRGADIAVDAFGCAYVTGGTWSDDFPIVNQYQTYHSFYFSDVFVSKLSSEGNSLIYSTYLRGAADDYGYGIALDSSGCAYVTGETESDDFPTEDPYQTYQGDLDVFITKLSSAGSSLIYSTYLGGSYDDDFGKDVTVDASGCAYVTGETYSADFPIVNQYQTYQGNQNYSDVFVTKLSSAGNSLIYSTYLGGSDYEFGQGIAVDSYGCAYVTGGTDSPDFPTENPYQATIQGYSGSVFVSKLSSTGNNLIYSTYLGGNYGNDAGLGIAVDASRCAYVTGYTESPTFPTVNPYQTFQGYIDVFVSKFSSTGNSLIYSTYLGGPGLDLVYGIALDASGCAYVTGETYSLSFPTENPYQATNQGDNDVFVTKFSPALNSWAVIAIDRSGSMFFTDPLSQSRLERAQLMAHDEIDQLLDFYDPVYNGVYQIAILSFNADGIVLLQDFTYDSFALHAAVDMIVNPRHDTPLAAAMCQAHCLLDQEDASSKLAFTYTDGRENESQNFDMCTICDPCNYLMETGWNFDCDPSNPASCTEWQMCLADQFASTGINIVHYFGEPINPFDKNNEGLEDMYFLKSAAEESSGGFFYHSDQETDGYICGDANRDFDVNISDAAWIINYVFVGGDPPSPIESGDANCDGMVNISDAVWIINYVFVGGYDPCDTDGNEAPDC